MKNENDILLGNVHTDRELQKFVDLINLEAKHFVIKPNWFTFVEGLYTDALTLDQFLKCIKGDIYIVEAYSWRRNDGSRLITEYNYLDNKDWISDQDKKELVQSGLAKVLEKHGVKYINTTEEVWKGDVIANSTIRGLVENRYGNERLQFPEFYMNVPRKIFELSQLPETIFINLSRVKTSNQSDGGFSLSLKNIFGLIPIPRRYKYHGDTLPQAIIDINKVYRSLFNIIDICEGIHTALQWNPYGKYMHDLGNYDLLENSGFVSAGSNPTTLDLLVAKFFGMNIQSRTLIRLANEQLSPLDFTAVQELEKRVDNFKFFKNTRI